MFQSNLDGVGWQRWTTKKLSRTTDIFEPTTTHSLPTKTLKPIDNSTFRIVGLLHTTTTTAQPSSSQQPSTEQPPSTQSEMVQRMLEDGWTLQDRGTPNQPRTLLECKFAGITCNDEVNLSSYHFGVNV